VLLVFCGGGGGGRGGWVLQQVPEIDAVLGGHGHFYNVRNVDVFGGGGLGAARRGGGSRKSSGCSVFLSKLRLCLQVGVF
jgi:hypothetical protein